MDSAPRFDRFVLDSVVGGRSVIDIPRLHFQDLHQVNEFIKSYGFDWDIPADRDKLWYFYRRSMVFLEEKLGFKKEEIPELLHDRRQVKDLRHLLLWSSGSQLPAVPQLQKWSCAILRIMHVFVHAENDLFASFGEEIQRQILTPFQDCIIHDGTTGKTLLRGAKTRPVDLLGFEVKPFKTSSSTVLKLLAKPSALALNVFDKLGFRFITPTLYDVFALIHTLVEENLLSFPHIIPDQTTNSLVDIETFWSIYSQAVLEGSTKKSATYTKSDLEKILQRRGVQGVTSATKGENQFSGKDYQFVKFISRKLIQIKNSTGQFSFFYPFEVQIMDKNAYEKIQAGPSEHQAYKDRQKRAARKRVMHDASDVDLNP